MDRYQIINLIEDLVFQLGVNLSIVSVFLILINSNIAYINEMPVIFKLAMPFGVMGLVLKMGDLTWGIGLGDILKSMNSSKKKKMVKK